MQDLPHGGSDSNLWEGRSHADRVTRYQHKRWFNAETRRWEGQIIDHWRDRVVGFTCGRCTIETKVPKPYVVRCKPCNREMYGWRQQKSVFEAISERITSWKELTLITLTTRNVIVGPDNCQHEVEGLRKSLMGMMSKLTRSKRDRNKLERSWWRNNIKGWLHTFEVVVTPVTMSVPTPWWSNHPEEFIEKVVGYRLNAHIHCLAERYGGPIDHKQLKEQAQAVGFGPVANIKWVKPKTGGKTVQKAPPWAWVKAGKATARYVLKYIMKARSEWQNIRYYERGGSWRGRVS